MQSRVEVVIQASVEEGVGRDLLVRRIAVTNRELGPEQNFASVPLVQERQKPVLPTMFLYGRTSGTLAPTLPLPEPP